MQPNQRPYEEAKLKNLTLLSSWQLRVTKCVLWGLFFLILPISFSWLTAWHHPAAACAEQHCADFYVAPSSSSEPLWLSPPLVWQPAYGAGSAPPAWNDSSNWVLGHIQTDVFSMLKLHSQIFPAHGIGSCPGHKITRRSTQDVFIICSQLFGYDNIHSFSITLLNIYGSTAT